MLEGGKDSSKMHTGGRINLELAVRKPQVLLEGVPHRYYELCVLAELKNALRSGDIWVHGSRQFRDFEGAVRSIE